MSVINKGTSFSNGEQLTAKKINDMVDLATFDQSATDSASTTVNSVSQIIVRDGGITAAKLATDSVETTKIAAGALTDLVYPIGSIFTTVNNYANSAAVVTAIGGTTWTAFGAGKVLVGLDSSDTDFDTAEETGGAKTVKLTSAESGVPAHTHTYSESSSGSPSRGVGVGASVPTAVGRQTANTGAASAADAASSHTNVQPYIVVYMWKRTA